MSLQGLKTFEGLLAGVATTASTGSAYIAQIDSGVVDSFGRLPVVVVLAGVSCLSVWLLYKSNLAALERAREHEENLLKVLESHSQEFTTLNTRHTEGLKEYFEQLAALTQATNEAIQTMRSVPCVKSEG